MTETFLATPDNWFDIQLRAKACADAGAMLDLTFVDPGGRFPMAQVALEELRAVQHTFGYWWSTLGSDVRPPSLGAGTYDSFLTEGRALLRAGAEAVLAGTDAIDAPAPALIAFPPLDHALFAEPQHALAFLTSFLALQHSRSLLSWVRSNASNPEGAAHAWFRIVLQKVAVEDELPEALASLRSTYGADAGILRTLLEQESQLLELCELQSLSQWSRALGLDRAPRNEPEPRAPRRNPPIGRIEPDVTVLVPSYRHEAFIEAALESVLAQTHREFRILVVDDCSPDGTVQRAAQIHDPRLQIEVNERNLGLGDSVLRAVEGITTPYVALLNSDDLFHPERLERCTDVLKRSPGVQLVATGLRPVDEVGRPLTVDTTRRLFDGANIANWVRWYADATPLQAGTDLLPELLERNFLVTSSNIVCRTGFLRSRRDILQGLKYCLDWQMFLAAAVDGSLAHLPEELLDYRLHGSNTVWFDDARATGHSLEVNRVLACTFARLFERGLSQPDAQQAARVLDLVAQHASKHPETNGFLLYAAERLGGRVLDLASQSDAVRTSVSLLSRPAGSPGADMDGLGRARAARAALVVAEVSREEEQQAKDKERRLREQLETVKLVLRERREELERLPLAPEWLLGDMLWNRARLVRVAHWVRLLQDRSNRWRLALGRAVRRAGIGRPRAVVAACWSFPILSQTFVYQEIQALRWAGFNYLVFCCVTNPRGELPAAFGDVWRRRVVLRSTRDVNEPDFDHFMRTRPERVEALLTRLAEATGMTRDALLQEPIVMMGFTFSRHVELSGAEYLHTYFFYDQSFMALMAAALLQIPRGITAYADHMLGDYPFKCVPLHMEMADIVVATSSRIRDELSAIGGGRFDSKILVKPNGIDTSRFPNVPPAVRLAQDGEPELISVSRLEAKKGLTYLVEAVGILLARGIPVRLHIVGGVDRHTASSAEYAKRLSKSVESLGLADRIVLHGSKQQHEFIPLLVRSRIFVAPYVETATGDKDGIPTALLEAMSTGLPVVATDAGSIKEVATDGVEALSVPQRDPVTLARAIERLLSDGALYARMSDAARRRAVSEFDVHVTEARLHERIRACVNPPSRA